MGEMEKALREELEKHLDTLRRNLEVVPMDVLKTKYKKPYQELKESICKAATAYTRHVSLGGIRIKQKSLRLRPTGAGGGIWAYPDQELESTPARSDAEPISAHDHRS